MDNGKNVAPSRRQPQFLLALATLCWSGRGVEDFTSSFILDFLHRLETFFRKSQRHIPNLGVRNRNLTKSQAFMLTNPRRKNEIKT